MEKDMYEEFEKFLNQNEIGKSTFVEWKMVLLMYLLLSDKKEQSVINIYLGSEKDV